MRVTKVRKLTDEKWLNLFSANYVHNGKKGSWLYASRRNKPSKKVRADAVIIVPVLKSRGFPPRLVMIREFRVPINAYSLAFPAGLLEDSEDIEEAARREMLEETGLEIIRFRKISPVLYSSTGMTDETAVMAFVDVRELEGSVPTLSASEDIEVKLLTIEEVRVLCDDPGDAIDAKAWNALLLFQQLGRLDGIKR